MTVCRICGLQGEHPEYSVREMLCGTLDEFSYFQCSACGCLQIRDIPADMAKYYPRDYYSFNAAAGSGSFLKTLPKKLRNSFAVFNRGIAGRALYAFRQDTMGLASLAHVPVTRDTRILDVGCGAGRLLSALGELGFRNLLGVDPYIAGEITIPSGARIIKAELPQVQGRYDVIMFHHSFEHIFNQLESLQAVHKLLDDRGTCLIRVPVSSSYAWRRYGINWFQLDAPRHFFLHSMQSLSLLAQQAGFIVRQVVFDSTELQFAGSELYERGMSLLDPDTGLQRQPESFFPASEIRTYKARAKTMNDRSEGDQAAFYLEKMI